MNIEKIKQNQKLKLVYLYCPFCGNDEKMCAGDKCTKCGTVYLGQAQIRTVTEDRLVRNEDGEE